jgi:hypothetical protein
MASAFYDFLVPHVGTYNAAWLQGAMTVAAVWLLASAFRRGRR